LFVMSRYPQLRGGQKVEADEQLRRKRKLAPSSLKAGGKTKLFYALALKGIGDKQPLLKEAGNAALGEKKRAREGRERRRRVNCLKKGGSFEKTHRPRNNVKKKTTIGDCHWCREGRSFT